MAATPFLYRISRKAAAALSGLARRRAPGGERARVQPGRVAFVGAGPGNVELLTLKAARLIETAEVIVADRLVGAEVLALAPGGAEVVVAGKTGFDESWSQADINALIVARGLAGRHVVRLKGGDPTVFARLDEEVAAVEAAGLAWQVVPGISAASAAAAGLGTGLTRRGRNDSVWLMTGHDCNGYAEHEWRELARGRSAAAIYMGKRAATFIRGRLMMHGAPADLPVTVVENASLPGERVIATRLIDLPKTLKAEAVDGPAVLLVGIEPRHVAVRVPEREAV
ncbi:uroporphyrinogen-III C-methyltransferase [Roseitranquillus sediminis]|uniref:uroporphyrinogen-III C-methyltransferase n=1 Tax=Roseitranquillus sediminis TaxID=2809051 RepID=UPI001D0C96EF|nr:uroporphyrinogen-III C-methyltransferase [Roseitranquillus sediminis]MBM9594184.1 uroporphyrinogen-III C-methyltransferase [Roseitranquillus sediminis]